jgi:hypothetical protein
MLVLFSLFFTILFFGIIWEEHMWDGFFQLGPGFKVGSIAIESWNQWFIFFSFITIYQIANVYMEETVGRKIEKQHIEHAKDTPRTSKDILELIFYNIYRWLGTIIHILVAVTRLDIWLIIAFIDTLARAYMWSNSPNGRRPRMFTM